MTIRTITINDITKVNFDPDKKNPYLYCSDRYVHIRSKNGSAVYVSADENCTADADGTSEIPAYGCAVFSMPHSNIIYLRGNGPVEIQTSSKAVSPFVSSGTVYASSDGVPADSESLTDEQLGNVIELIGSYDAEHYDSLTDGQINSLIDMIVG